MSEEYGKGAHTVYDVQYHLVWVAKYRYHILTGESALRARELVRQTREARNLTILGGYVSKDHIHFPISSGSDLAPSKVVQYILSLLFCSPRWLWKDYGFHEFFVVGHG